MLYICICIYMYIYISACVSRQSLPLQCQYSDTLQRGGRFAAVAAKPVAACLASLHVEYAEHRLNSGILFIFSPVYEYSNLEYEHGPVEYRVHRAEYVIHIRVAASQEYVNIYSTCRPARCGRVS